MTGSARYFIEEQRGFDGHRFLDRTDRPMPALLTQPTPRVRVQMSAIARRERPGVPPYRVPLVAEIQAAPRNGLRVVSTFAGGGGSSTGYRLAGYSVVWASEFIPEARATYHANWPDTPVDARDIRTVEPSDILRAAGLQEGELDVLDGSPPCSSFSVMGKREKGWGKRKLYSDRVAQRTDDLFWEYARILKGLQPRVFVAENVPGMARGTAKGFYLEVLELLRGCGYQVAARVLAAQWLGVPQMRQRLIFVGVRRDLERAPVFPKPLPYYYTVGDAFAGLEQAPVEPEASMEKFATGRELRKLTPGGISSRYFSLVRASESRPAHTLSAHAGLAHFGSVAHPSECRKLSTAEARRICGFPDDYVLTGTYAQRIERLGRAVPPPMMERVAATLRDRVLRA